MLLFYFDKSYYIKIIQKSVVRSFGTSPGCLIIDLAGGLIDIEGK